MAAPSTAPKKKKNRVHTDGIAHVQASFNNTIISITTLSGDVLTQWSAGRCGYKGSKKGTPFAAQLAAESAAKEVQNNYGMKRIEVEVIGPGAGRDSAIRALRSTLEITKLSDRTPLPHNGCRPPKERRV